MVAQVSKPTAALVPPLCLLRELDRLTDMKYVCVCMCVFIHQLPCRFRPENMQSSGQNVQSPWITVPVGCKSACISEDGRVLSLQVQIAAEPMPFALCRLLLHPQSLSALSASQPLSLTATAR